MKPPGTETSRTYMSCVSPGTVPNYTCHICPLVLHSVTHSMNTPLVLRPVCTCVDAQQYFPEFRVPCLMMTFGPVVFWNECATDKNNCLQTRPLLLNIDTQHTLTYWLTWFVISSLRSSRRFTAALQCLYLGRKLGGWPSYFTLIDTVSHIGGEHSSRCIVDQFTKYRFVCSCVFFILHLPV